MALGTPVKNVGMRGVFPPFSGERAQSRRRIPLVAAGMALVALCAVGVAVGLRAADDRLAVLVTTRALAAGHVLAASDLRSVRVGVDGDLGLIPAARQSTVVGQVVARPLRSGALLGTADVGSIAWPEAGTTILPLALKAGRFPDGLAAGATVSIVVHGQAAAAGGGKGQGNAGTPERFTATVTSVAPGYDGEGSVVVSVQLPIEGAARIGPDSDVVVLLLPREGE